jgi:DNA adenine methylase
LLPTIAELAPEGIDRYIEPFAGSAIVFLALNPKRSIINDLNSGLVRTYKVIRRRCDEVHSVLRGLRKSRGMYYFLRAIPPAIWIR